MSIVYRIRDWAKHFENNRTREMKSMSWVPVPNKHDGEGLQRIFMEQDGIAIYGCWHLILQVASKCLRERGTLLRDDRTPLTAMGLALKTGWKHPEQFQRALDFLSDDTIPEVRWVERVETTDKTGCGDPAPSCGNPAPRARAREWNGMEQNGMEGKGREGKDSAAEPPPPSPKPDASCSGENVHRTMLVGQFCPKCKWTGKRSKVFEHIDGLLAVYDAEVISKAIAEHGRPGAKPWQIQDWIEGEGKSREAAAPQNRETFTEREERLEREKWRNAK